MKLHLKLCLIVAVAASFGLAACGGSNHNKKSKNAVRQANEKNMRDKLNQKAQEDAAKAAEDAAKTAEQTKKENEALEKTRLEAEAREKEVAAQLAAAEAAKVEAEQKAATAEAAAQAAKSEADAKIEEANQEIGKANEATQTAAELAQQAQKVIDDARTQEQEDATADQVAETSVVEKTDEELAAEEKTKQEEAAKLAVRTKVSAALVALQKRLAAEGKDASQVATKSDLNIELVQDGSDAQSSNLKSSVSTRQNICILDKDNKITINLSETNSADDAMEEKTLVGTFDINKSEITTAEGSISEFKVVSFVNRLFTDAGSNVDVRALVDNEVTEGSNNLIGLIGKELDVDGKKFLQINGILDSHNSNAVSKEGNKLQTLTISGDFRCTVELK